MTEGGLTDPEIKTLPHDQQVKIEVEKHNLENNKINKVINQPENLEKDYEITVPALTSENVTLEQQNAALKKQNERLTSK